MKLYDFDDRFFRFVAAWVAAHPDKKPEEVEFAYNDLMQEWLGTPADWLGGMKPEEYFLQWSAPEDLIALLEEYDRQHIGLPELLYTRITEIGAPCMPALIDIARDPERGEALRGTCIALAEDIGGAEALELSLSLLLSGEEEDELAEEAADTLKRSADPALVSRLMEAYDTAEEWTQARILEICVKVHPAHGRLYDELLHRLYSRHEQIAYYAGLLGELGDPRAAEPMKHMLVTEDIGYLDYLELRNAVEMLGEDPGPDRSFDGDPDYELLGHLE